MMSMMKWKSLINTLKNYSPTNVEKNKKYNIKNNYETY